MRALRLIQLQTLLPSMARWLRMERQLMHQRQTLRDLQRLTLQLALPHRAVAPAARRRRANNKRSDGAALPPGHAPPYLIVRSIHAA
jgi:hypothetical protein